MDERRVKTGSITVDLTGPTLGGVTPAADATTWFAPNGDGYRETVALSGTVTERGSIVVHVRDQDGSRRSYFTVPTATNVGRRAWDGKANGGGIVPDGRIRRSAHPARRSRQPRAPA